MLTAKREIIDGSNVVPVSCTFARLLPCGIEKRLSGNIAQEK
jgi:hypothetical protein